MYNGFKELVKGEIFGEAEVVRIRRNMRRFDEANDRFGHTETVNKRDELILILGTQWERILLASLDPLKCSPKTVGVVVGADHIRQSQTHIWNCVLALEINFALHLILTTKAGTYP